MRLVDVVPDLRVDVTGGPWSGRTGSVIAVGTFEGGPSHIGALVDLGGPAPALVALADLEPLILA